MSLSEIKNILSQYFQTQPILRAWIFGSYARGEQTTSSDIDILVDFDPENGPSLLGYARIALKLEELIGIPVDLVENGTLYPRIAPYVEKDKILIYERGT